MRRSRDIFPLPRLASASLRRFSSRRLQKRMAPVRKTLDIANAAIYALNEMHGTPTRACVAGHAAAPARVAEVL